MKDVEVEWKDLRFSSILQLYQIYHSVILLSKYTSLE